MLPSVFQTVTQRRFFDATFEQLFAKRESKKYTGFIGRKDSGLFDPASDYYIPERNKDRTRYQLEPMSLTVDEDTLEKKNFNFYNDLLNYLKSNGSDTSNHSRLFESEYYSYSPPIDADKFANYQNYIWAPTKFQPVEISGLDDAFIEKYIIGEEVFNASEHTNVTIVPDDIVFSSDMRVKFVDSESYNEALTIQGVGSGIILVPDEIEILSSVTYSVLPWDNKATVTGLTLNNEFWDGNTYDVIETSTNSTDYITIARGALNKNLWSRSNKWFHIDSLTKTLDYTGEDFPATARRANRPIIEFEPQVEMYKTGNFHYADIDIVTENINHFDVDQRYIDDVRNFSGFELLSNNDTIMFVNDDSSIFSGDGIVANQTAWRVVLKSGIVNLVPVEYDLLQENVIDLTLADLKWDDVYAEYSLDNTSWDSTYEWEATEIGRAYKSVIYLDSGKNYFVDTDNSLTLPDATDPTVAEGTEIWLAKNENTEVIINSFKDIHTFLYNDVEYTSLDIDLSVSVKFTLVDSKWVMTDERSVKKPVLPQDMIVAVGGRSVETGGTKGLTFYFDTDLVWSRSANNKVKANQAPLFSLYDVDGVSIDDEYEYPQSNFEGNEIFSYQVSDDPYASRDQVLGFPLVYKSLAQSSDIIFENDIETEQYSYVDGIEVADITGYYFYRSVNDYDSRYKFNEWTYENVWHPAQHKTVQPVIDLIVAEEDNQSSFRISCEPEKGIESVNVFVNGAESYDFILGTAPNGDTYVLIYDVIINKGDDVRVETISDKPLPDDSTGFYGMPLNLEINPTNEPASRSPYGEIIGQFVSVIRNQNGFIGNPRNETNNYRDTGRDKSVGVKIIQSRSPLTLPLLFTTGTDLDIIDAFEYVKEEYKGVKSKLITMARNIEFDPSTDFGRRPEKAALNEILEMIATTRRASDAFKWSDTIGLGRETFNTSIYVAHSDYDSYALTVSDKTASYFVNDIDLPYASEEETDIIVTTEIGNVEYVYGTDYTVTKVPNGVMVSFSEDTAVSNGERVFVKVRKLYSPITIDVTPEDLQSSYLYRVTEVNGQPQYNLLLRDYDYTIIDDQILFPYGSELVEQFDELIFKGYQDTKSSGVPATPSFLGMQTCYKPKFFVDKSKLEETVNLLGHDGSVTLAYTEFARLADGSIRTDANGEPIPVGLSLLFDAGTYTTMSEVSDVDLRNYMHKNDIILKEFELDMFNNADATAKKVDFDEVLSYFDIKPSISRTETGYTISEFNDALKSRFYKWASINKVDPAANDFYLQNQWKTWNYSRLKLFDIDENGIRTETDQNAPGHWKGIYEYYFDTFRPDVAPWEMLGIKDKPDWWEVNTEDTFADNFVGYGTDYSSNNVALWTDIEQGIIRRGPRKGIHSDFNRPSLTGIADLALPENKEGVMRPVHTTGSVLGYCPVSETGELIEPKILLDVYSVTQPDSNWKFGDYSPAEEAWKNTSEYKFDVCIAMFVLKPALFASLFFNTSNTTIVHNQQLIDVNTRTRPSQKHFKMHGEIIDGEVTKRKGYQQYVSDYLLSKKKDVYTSFGVPVRNQDIHLGYRVGGFTDYDSSRFYLEGVSQFDSANLLIPQNNYSVSLYTSSPIDQFVYSGILVRKAEDGYEVYGYDTPTMAFDYYDAAYNSRTNRISVGGTSSNFTEFKYGERYLVDQIVRKDGVFYRATVEHTANLFVKSNWEKLATLPKVGSTDVVHYQDRDSQTILTIPYGTKFTEIQDLYDFIIGYSAKLEDEGWVFDSVVDGKITTWKDLASKMLYWISQDWDIGASLTLSPFAESASIEIDHGYLSVVESDNGISAVTDVNGYAMPKAEYEVVRDGKRTTISSESGIYGLRLSSIETEHVVVFDHITDFGDVLYNKESGARQQRLKFSGTKTQNWSGTYEAPGFLLNGNAIIPNIDTLADRGRYMYDDTSGSDATDLHEAARHLIGFQEQEYMNQLQISEDAQYKFYHGFVKQKGTYNAISKILRSATISDKDLITYYEDWAFKVSDFGGTDENIRLEFKTNYSDVKSDTQVYRINGTESKYGGVTKIEILSNDEIYTRVPSVIIGEPDDQINGRQATAYVVLDDNRSLKEIVVTDSGQGYENAPKVYIPNTDVVRTPLSTLDDNNEVINTDVLVSVIEKEIERPNVLNDSVVDVDINDSDSWLYKNRGIVLETAVPVTTVEKSYADNIPSAGFVDANDVDFEVFSDVVGAMVTNDIQPGHNIHVAKYNDSWNVFSVVDASYNVESETSVSFVLADIFGFDISAHFGSEEGINRTIWPALRSVPNIELTKQLPFDTDVSSLTELNVTLNAVINSTLYTMTGTIEENTGVLTISAITDTEGKEVKTEDLPLNNDDTQSVYTALSKKIYPSVPDDYPNTISSRVGALSVNDNYYFYTDSFSKEENGVVTEYGSTINRPGQGLTFRSDIIDSSMFDVCTLRDESSSRTLARLELYDPLSGFIPTEAKQNIEIISSVDPVDYNLEINDANVQPGQVWWDTSTIAYYDYQQGDVNYKSKYWGRMFPGSTASVYEWTESTRLPKDYIGEGTPMDTDKYVTVRTYNTQIGKTEVMYYFWVKDKTTVPDVEGRTAPVKQVANILENIVDSSTGWYAPISVDNNNFSFAIGNASFTLRNRDVVIDLQFRTSNNGIKNHTQWELLREGDKFSPIPDKLWNKMVDSVVGISDAVSYEDYINSAYSNKGVGYLPVPDKSLNARNALGVETRPQQSMVSDVTEARRVFVSSVNRMLSEIDVYSKTGATFDYLVSTKLNRTSKYATSKDWYAEGYDSLNTYTTVQYEYYNDMITAIESGDIIDGDVVKIQKFNPLENDYYKTYVIKDSKPVVVRAEKSTGIVDESLAYNTVSLKVAEEIRAIISVLEENIFTDLYKINLNSLFFAIVKYAVSENETLDWVFKTTYVTFVQDGKVLTQQPMYQPDLISKFLDYVNEVKPYSSKIRDSVMLITYESDDDHAIVKAFDNFIEDVTTLDDIYNEEARLPNPSYVEGSPQWIPNPAFVDYATTPNEPVNLRNPAFDKYISNPSFVAARDGTILRGARIEQRFDRVEEPPEVTIDGNWGWDSIYWDEEEPKIELTVVGGKIVDATVVNPGPYYILPPSYEIVGDGTGAELQINISDGIIASVAIISGGQDYTFAELLLSHNKWDTHTSYYDPDITRLHPNVHVDASTGESVEYILDQGASGAEELIKVVSRENIVIDTVNDVYSGSANHYWDENTTTWDIDSGSGDPLLWDQQGIIAPIEVPYKTHIKHLDKDTIVNEYYAVGDKISATLEQEITQDDLVSEILISSQQNLQTGTGTYDVWINNEQFRYTGITARTGGLYALINVTRSLEGTSPSNHSIGDKVIDATYKVVGAESSNVVTGGQTQEITVNNPEIIETTASLYNEYSQAVSSGNSALVNEKQAEWQEYSGKYYSTTAPLTNPWYKLIWYPFSLSVNIVGAGSGATAQAFLVQDNLVSLGYKIVVSVTNPGTGYDNDSTTVELHYNTDASGTTPVVVEFESALNAPSGQQHRTLSFNSAGGITGIQILTQEETYESSVPGLFLSNPLYPDPFTEAIIDSSGAGTKPTSVMLSNSGKSEYLIKNR